MLSVPLSSYSINKFQCNRSWQGGRSDTHSYSCRKNRNCFFKSSFKKKISSTDKKVKKKKRFYGRERPGLPAFDLVKLLSDPALKRLFVSPAPRTLMRKMMWDTGFNKFQVFLGLILNLSSGPLLSALVSSHLQHCTGATVLNNYSRHFTFWYCENITPSTYCVWNSYF